MSFSSYAGVLPEQRRASEPPNVGSFGAEGANVVTGFHIRGAEGANVVTGFHIRRAGNDTGEEGDENV